MLRSKDNYIREKNKGHCFFNSLANVDGELVKNINVKRQQGYEKNSFSDSQLWKLDVDMLQNKEGSWKSNDTWKFTYKGDKISIENIKKKKFLGAINNGSKVILEDFEDDKDGQLWKKGELNPEGYFTLKNDRVSKFLTADSSNSLKLKGNIT